MMFSATDFLPDSIRTFTNLATSTLPYFGSGRISRLGTSRRRGISIPFNLQLSTHAFYFCALPDGHHDHPLTRPTGADTFPLDCHGKLLFTSCQLLHALRRTSNAPACDP